MNTTPHSSLFVHECENDLRTRWARICGDEPTEATISTVPPLVKGPYTQDGLTCPHGITYWMEPTGEQIAQWVRDGVK